jgi:hypothetical protein
MNDERDDAAAREVKAELRHVADTILDLEACGRLLGEAPRLLKLLGDARSRLFAWEVRVARAAREPAASGRTEGGSARVVDEAVQREEEAAREWHRGWERGESEL